jgi:hypothetical protein
MRTLSFLFWTTCSVALGIWLATAPVGGRTPWEHAKRLWAESNISLPELPGLASLRSARAAPETTRPASKIAERHTDQERDAVNRLIAHRAEK